MSWFRVAWPVVATALLVAACGCAPAYHAYPCGCVPYGYCAEPPLPHAMYCACPTPIAAKSTPRFQKNPAEEAKPVGPFRR